jgi:hypothetical protein
VDVKLIGMFLLASMIFVNSSASAQSCGAPLSIYPRANVTGNTCMAQNELGTLCIVALSFANDIIYSFAVTSPYTATSISLTNNTPSWNAGMVLMLGECNGNTPCVRNADAGGPGANETLSVAGLADGAYFLVVTSTVGDTTCGQYGLTVDGTPVELLLFDVS